MSNLIYYLIFAILTTCLLIWLEKNFSNFEQGTKVVEIDGVQYMVPDFKPREFDPKSIKSIGSRLTCESLGEILGQKVKYNSTVPGSKSMISGDSLYVDCHEPNTNIMVDYKPMKLYDFNGSDHINNDVYEFYNRLALDNLKKDKISQLRYNYIEVPYSVDICEYNNGEKSCEENKPYSLRKSRIKNFLHEKLLEVF